MTRASLLFENLVPDATISSDTQASSDLAIGNLQTYQLFEKWRSGGVTDETITVSLSESDIFTAVALWSHNLSAEATVRLRISNNSDLSSPVYDATFYAWPSIDGLGEGRLDFGTLGGVPLLDDFEDYQFYSVFVLNLVYDFLAVSGGTNTVTLPRRIGFNGEQVKPPTNVAGGVVRIVDGTGSGQERIISGLDRNVLTVTADWDTPPDGTSEIEIDLSEAQSVTTNDLSYLGQYLGITISDSTNSDGYFQAGYLYAGDYLQPDYDISRNYSLSVVDRAQRRRTYGQNVWTNSRRKWRRASFSFPILTEEEARVRILNTLGYQAGQSIPIIFIPFTENSFRTYIDTIYGILDGPVTLNQTRQDYTRPSYRAEFTISEVL